METERIEYLRKRNGVKKGALWCGIDMDNYDSVIIGFSLCHSIDKYDHINGKRQAGFGLDIARNRGDKWRFHRGYFIQVSHFENKWERLTFENPDTRTIVEIPPSIFDRLRTFIIRCKKYYKDKTFPEWADAILQEDEEIVEDED